MSGKVRFKVPRFYVSEEIDVSDGVFNVVRKGKYGSDVYLGVTTFVDNDDLEEATELRTGEYFLRELRDLLTKYGGVTIDSGLESLYIEIPGEDPIYLGSITPKTIKNYVSNNL